MKFSVLMSLYIKENPFFFAESLESLVHQTYCADEIILVLDGHITPELTEVIERFKTKLPLKLVCLEQNVGLGKALNEGIKHCSHEWIFRMDTDDICFPERFAKQVKFIEENPDIVLCSTQIAEFNQDPLIILGIRKVPLSFENIIKFNKIRSPFNHMTVAYKKSVLEDVGGYQHHLFLEDYNLWNRIIAKGYKVGNLPEVLLYARTNGDAMIGRRRGLIYAKSEWKLFKLKHQLKIQDTMEGLITFLIRTIPRLLPVFILKSLYKKVRKKN